MSDSYDSTVISDVLLKKIKEFLKDYIVSKSSALLERYNFNKRERQLGKNIPEYKKNCSSASKPLRLSFKTNLRLPHHLSLRLFSKSKVISGGRLSKRELNCKVPWIVCADVEKGMPTITTLKQLENGAITVTSRDISLKFA
ncbi:hypothetical protein RF11_05866 [Thelohanellus kitauei]|uniref:Uncharacterized protein n=1 Tax=Thelohanellus kitauei TaxID=669202 RepID=A0A0C2I7G8_THEKT|nr:hypothetical protein RF11_05866 [Thelohanellus kitauei]